MSLQVEKLEKNMAKLTIEASAEDFEKAIQKVYLKARGRINIPGFRKGKAPRKLIEKMYGTGVFYEDAANDLIPTAYAEALKDCDLEIVSRPEINVTQIESGKPFIFTAEVAVKPEVTLGEYKGVEVEKSDVEVTDEDINKEVDKERENNSRTIDVDDRAVESGDIIKLDFDGSVDGVPFAGGKAENYTLTIGSGSFIAGFEDGLIGVMPGETVDLNLTFPENYGKSDLAGQAVVFTVTVNYIQPAQDGEFSDEVISNFGIDGVTNEEELRQYAYDYLNENAQQNYETNVQQAVMDAFMANNTFTSVPEALVQKYSDAAESSITSMASAYGVDADTFTQYYYGQDLASFLATYSEEAAKQDIALQAVANRENLNISDEELDQILLDRATAAGYDTIEEYIGETSKEDYREYFLYDKVTDYLVENAKITNN